MCGSVALMDSKSETKHGSSPGSFPTRGGCEFQLYCY